MDVKTFFLQTHHHDSGIRHLLNYGHTLAHALEKLSSYEIGHGHAVAKGIAFTASLSYDLGWCGVDCRDRIHALLRSFGYDLSIGFSPRDVAEAMASDKKRSGDGIKFITSSAIGQADIKLIPLAQLGKILATYNEICPNSSAVSHRGAPLFAPQLVVSAPPSKSYLHREIIVAMLSGQKFVLDAGEASEDIIATYEATKTISKYINSTTFGSHDYNASSVSEKLSLDCKESGSTLRFLLPIVAALGIETEFKLAGRLRERPMQQLISQLENHGANIDIGESGNITISTSDSHITPGAFNFANPESSQYISGLLFALPLLNGDSAIHVHNNLESSAYVVMTLAVLDKYGIKVNYMRNDREWIFNIPGNQKYSHSAHAPDPEGDWSNAAFLLALGALGKSPIRVRSLPLSSIQGDMKILDLLEDFGVTVNRYTDIVDMNAGTVDVFPCKKLIAIPSIDASGCPDLVPIIALIASLANGTTIIKNAERLRYKESDRIASTCGVLRRLGANITETKDGLIIEGTDRLHGSYEGNAYGDHRIIMMLAVSSLISDGIIIIHDSAAVAKSYPNFFKVLNKLGLAGNVILV